MPWHGKVVSGVAGQSTCALEARPLSRRELPRPRTRTLEEGRSLPQRSHLSRSWIARRDHHNILWQAPMRSPRRVSASLPSPVGLGEGSDVRSPVSRVLAPREGETAISLGPTSRPASNDLPGRHGAGHRREPSLFDLSPGGVCPAGPVTRSAVRSYRTVSPLPLALRPPAVCFLWHFP